MPPLVIIEGPSSGWREAVTGVAADGWREVSGFAPPYRTGRVVRSGIVASVADARAALVAALAGQGVVVHATAARAVIDRLVDDLRRLGPVDHRVGVAIDVPALDREIRQLLGLLAEGQSLGEAAATLGLSRRTADRRLAEARRLLDTNRTTEAISRAARRGWLRKDDSAPG